MNDLTPGIGHNAPPDYAKIETERLERDYRELEPTINALLDEAREIPKVIEDSDTALRAGALIKRMGDVNRSIEEKRKVEGEPSLRANNAVNAFFFRLREKLAKRNRTDNPGAIDILISRVDDYQARKLAEERAERERRAKLAAEEARKAEEERRRLEAEAIAAREKAERARKPETIEEKTAAAIATEAQATAAAVEAEVARERAQDAHIESLAKSADLVRERGDTGVLLTSRREAYALITDPDKLDKEALWPFIGIAEKAKALRAWAKTHGHNKPMAGAEIGHRSKAVAR